MFKRCGPKLLTTCDLAGFFYLFPNMTQLDPHCQNQCINMTMYSDLNTHKMFLFINFQTLLKIEQFQDLMSQENKPQATTPGCELDHSLAEKGRNSNDNEVNVDKSNESSTQSEYEVKSTDVSMSLIGMKEKLLYKMFCLVNLML